MPAANFGPHTKYFPYVLSEEKFLSPLVTADDDMFYPANWLKDLYSAFLSNPTTISCHRARTICFSNEELAPFHTWPFTTSDSPDPLNFLEGVSGVIYPPEFLHRLKECGDAFLSYCPRHDDVWLNIVAIRSGFPRRQLSSKPQSYPEIIGTNTSGLWQDNQGSAGESQLRKTFTVEDLSLLRRLKVASDQLSKG